MDQNFFYHLMLLRKALFKTLFFFGMVLILAVIFSRPLYSTLAKPLIYALPHHDHLIATEVTAPLLVPLKLALIVSMLMTIPVFFWQLWRFAAPGLWNKEKKISRILLSFSILLFYIGVLFAYFVVFPMIFKFFVLSTPQNVVMMPDMSGYLSFVLKLFITFGAAFEVPVIVWLLTALNLVAYETLKKSRRYVIVLAFILGMFLTPPDVISQVLLALPLWMLYEFGLWLAKFNKVTRSNPDES